MNELSGRNFNNDTTAEKLLCELREELEYETRVIEALVAAPGQPLTLDRLEQHAPAVHARIVAEGGSSNWVTDDSAVPLPVNSPILQLSGERADFKFAVGMYTTSNGYNNFWSKIREQPDETSTVVTSFAIVEASKPYLIRAHKVAPALMGMLQRATASMTMDEFYSHLESGSDPDTCQIGEAELLTASRVAYVMMTNLMRIDDIQTQARQLGMVSSQVIGDPAIELYT